VHMPNSRNEMLPEAHSGVPVLDPWLGAYDPVVSLVDLRGHLVVSLQRQDGQVRPLLSQTMAHRTDEGQQLRPFLAQPA
jgi:hypothetical protein